MRKKFYYTVYLNSSDTIIASGLAEDCAKQMKKSINNFFSTISKNTIGNRKRYKVIKETVIVNSNNEILFEEDF